MAKITSIEVVTNIELNITGETYGKNGARVGISQAINRVFGSNGCYDGYKITTEEHEYHLLIENGQSCCESWGYFVSDDNYLEYVNANLLDVKFTDVALNTTKLNESDYYVDDGGIQFVDFETDKGILQFTVYNSHNGYYGHPIVFTKDNEVLLSDIL